MTYSTRLFALVFAAACVFGPAAGEAIAQNDSATGYFVISTRGGSPNWTHDGAFDDEESAVEEMKTLTTAGRTCALWVVTVALKDPGGWEPIWKNTAYLKRECFDFRNNRLTKATPNVNKFRLGDEIRRSIDPQATKTNLERIVSAPGRGTVTPDDRDADGVKDALEDQLALKFAPIVFHHKDEKNFPTNVDWFLRHTTLRFKVESRNIDELVQSGLAQADLHFVRRNANGPRARPPRQLRDLMRNRLIYVDSFDCCDRRKQFTFYLTDVADAYKGGSVNTEDWTTYTHVYANRAGGITIQYWRFYAFNTGHDVGVTKLGSHGGDWEGIHVVLDRNQTPVEVALLGHTGIEVRPWSQMRVENGHPKIYAGFGSHPSEARGDENGVRQETWPGGVVRRPGGQVSRGGKLVNVGEKAHPLNEQTFIGYSGLWGSPGTFTWTSGYWGPGFNETGEKNGFEEAWCRGMNPRKTLDDECNCCRPTTVRGPL